MKGFFTVTADADGITVFPRAGYVSFPIVGTDPKMRREASRRIVNRLIAELEIEIEAALASREIIIKTKRGANLDVSA